MIKQEGRLFHLTTKNTSYIFRIEDAQHLEHLHYGKKIRLGRDAEQALEQKHSSLPSATINYAPSVPNLSMELLRGEISTLGKGDYGDPFMDLEFPDGSRTCDFIYDCAEILPEKPELPGLPSALPPSGKESSLKITLKEANGRPVKLLLYYTVYEGCDAITRSAVLENTGSEPIILRKLLSSQLDFEDSGYLLTSFHGSWTSEMHKSVTPCAGKTVVNETRVGFSSNRANPFVMLSRPDCTETAGEVYGSNLIYSGNHRECAQSGELERLRFSTGIQPEGFQWTLDGQERFYTPEAVLSYSCEGFEGLSRNFHNFIRSYIVRGAWAHKPRPVLLNSWEAAYFNFTEEKLLSMASCAKDLGVELFVLDDGWFGERNNTKTSMGDWVCNKEKLPGGLEALSSGIHRLGMDFGIWVEPEAVSMDSHIFRAHPHWSLSIPGQPNSEGRNQRLMDLCNPEVTDYLYEALCRIFSSGVDYVKWDMNRGISDCYSPFLDKERQGETGHRYILGLYALLDRLTKRFPDILFESCASGGNRADLGILCYMPQFWASDNSDALSRMQIQTNYSYGYPLSVLGCHVSSVPNHQTMRETPISTRYEAAAYGLLGYELDPRKLSHEDLEDIKEQIQHYKKQREWLMNASLYRLKSGGEGYYSILMVSRDRQKASVMTFQEIFRSGRPMYVLRTRGLEEKALYHLRSRAAMMNVKPVSGRMVNLSLEGGHSSTVRMPRETEDYTLYGDFLNESGIRLKSDFIGHNLDEDTRYYPDYATRLYDLESLSTAP
ncbi:MAG: alpha-galactosidase [Clostridium sp.]|nr:alpha-galactosidase [Clostridium sp.]